jgi:large repetitive protein
MQRMRMSRRSPLLGLGLAWGCLLCLLALLLPVAVHAEGKPNLGLSVTSPKSILFGAKATVTLEASNPTGEPYGYNLSYRAVLPEGVAYVAKSTKIGTGGAPPEPTVIANQPKTGETTLIWSNVGDLSPASHSTLSFEATPSQVTYPVASEFTVPAEAFVAEAPRYLPKFKANGEPKGPESTSFTGYAKGSTKTAISALEIKQEEGSPEGEILRGVHDHQTVYKVTVTNNSVNATTGVNVDDWLPASLEYLGCGGAGADHTTDAPTNPGSAEEYPGSGPIDVAALGGCTAPALVETVETDPDGSGVDPDAVYTHVRWTVAELKPGESRTFEFRAAVPLRENTTAWTGAEPTPASGHQAANLDNNSGKETKDGESIVTFAKAEGLYKGTTPVSAEEHLTRVAKDITTEKSANLTTLSDGQVSKWTILVHSSEYRYNTKVEVTDTLPNGLCPLSSTNLSNPVSAECEPNQEPSSPYASTKEEENGTWKLVWDETTDPALATLKQNETTTITFYSKTRTHYQSKHAQAGPILSNDKIENTVLANATTNVVCDNDTDCSEKGAKPIDHERPLSEPVQDNSHFTQTAEGPAIKKEVGASGTNCLGDTYTSAIPVYRPGDLICWRLQASFPATLSTHGTEVTDFLPGLVSLDEAFNSGKGEAATSEDTLPGTTFDDSEAGGGETGGALKWTLPESGIVGNGSQRFERVFATSATLTKGTPLGDLQGNLMKFASINSKGESFALRAEADFKLQFPQLSLEKQIVKVNGKAIAPTTSATIEGGKEAEFALTVSNIGEVAAQNTEVRDLLPSGLTCAAIVAGSISNKGACSGGLISWGETGLGQEAIGVPAGTETTPGKTVLHFTVKLPPTIDPATTLEDKAGVREYHSATNTGGEYTYIPAKNIDPTLTEEQANVPAANAQASLVTEDVKVEKTHTSAVVETGNSAAQATIGEVVTFEVSATVPAEETLSGTAKLTDPGIPTTRLIYEAGSIEVLLNGSPAPAGFKAEEVALSPVVVFPENYLPEGGTAAKVTMRFKARVANVEANNTAGIEPAKSIPNVGRLAWTNPLSGAQTREASDTVPLVEPSLTLTQTPANATKVHGGQLVEYSLKLKNATGASTAFNNKIVDTVPTGITPTNSKGEKLENGQATASGGIWNEGARTITWELAKLEGGKEQAYAFYGTVVESPVTATTYKNTAIATTGSLKEGAEEKGRTAKNAPTGTVKEPIKERYEAKTEASLEIEGPTIAKETASTTATIGHRVKYTLIVTLPAHVIAYDQTVLDVLPDSLDFDEYVSAECTSGCPPEAAPTVSTYKPAAPSSTTTIGWYLGNLESTAVTRMVKLVFYASVRAKHRSGGATIEAGASIANTASINYNQSHEVSFEEEKIPSASKFKKNVGSNTVTTKAIEPKLALVKEVSLDGGKTYSPGPVTLTDGSSLSYRLKLTNSGGAPAYGAIVTDKPPSSLEAITPTTNAGDVTKNAEGEIAWKVPGPIAAEGGTVELVYTAKLVPVKQLSPGQAVNNEAKVPTYFGVSETEQAEKLKNYFNGPIEYREYGGLAAKVQATVALPTLTIEKAALEGAKYQASANAEVNQPFTWRVIVTNTSTVAAKKLKVSDILPANWEYIGGASFSKGGSIAPTEAGTLEPGKELTWSTSIELAAGASTTLTYQAKPTLAAETNPGSGKAGVNSVSATVLDAAENPEDAKGPFGAGPATASGVLLVPVLTVTKTPVKASVAAGAEDEYKIVVKNTGAGVAREVLAEDTLPTGMTYKAGSATAEPTTGFSEKSASATKVVWEVASIAAGASVEIKVPVGTDASLAEGTELKNKVAVQAPAAPSPVKAEGTITLTTSAELEATKSATPKTVTPGKEVTYTISVLNKGPSVAKVVKLIDPLPVGTKFVSADTGCSNVAGTVECLVGELAPNMKASYEVTVLVEGSVTKPILNTVEVTSVTPDPKLENNKATAEVKVTPEADLSLEKESLESEVTDGQQATFKLTAKNNGPSDVSEAKVVDTLPTGLTYVRVTGATCTPKGQEVTCQLGTLVAGGKVSFELVTKAEAPGDLINSATVSSPTTDPKPLNNKATAEVKVLPSADLQITKTAAPKTVKVGENVTYTLLVVNNGPDAAQNVLVSDDLPAGESYVSDNAGCEANVQQEVKCELGELAKGAESTIQIVVKIGLTLSHSTVANTAVVSSPTADPDEANNESTATVEVEPAADLSIEKTASPTSVNVKGEVTYTLLVVNHGPDAAQNVVVTDELPSGESYVSDDAGCAVVPPHVICALGELANGHTSTIHLVVSVALSLADSTVTNVAKVSSTTLDPKEADNESSAEVTVAPAANLSLEKTVAPETVEVPGEVTYTLTATNQGPDTAQEAKITDVLPTGESYVSGDPGCSASGQTVTCTLGEVASGAIPAVHFKALVSVSLAEQKIVNHASVSSQTFDPDPTNNEAHAEVSTLPSADLELVKTALTPEVHPGQQASFSLVTTNKGPSDAQEAKLVDTLPAGLAYVSAGGASCEAAGQVVTCALGTITVGSSVTVELTTQPAGLGSYINTAIVSSTTPDPDPGNNSSEAIVKVVPVPVVTPVTPPTAATPPASGVSPSSGSMARTKVTLRKLVRERVLAPGGRLDYRLIVRNAGTQIAEKLQVCDNLPERTTVIARGGGHLAGARICFTLAALAAGRIHIFTIVLRADSDASGQIVNHATVTGRNFDPAHAQASTTVAKASVSPARENHVTG